MRPAQLGALELVSEAGDIAEECFVHVLETLQKENRVEKGNGAVFDLAGGKEPKPEKRVCFVTSCGCVCASSEQSQLVFLFRSSL